MKFIDKLERKFGRFGIPNLTVYIIVCYVIGYALMIVNPGMLNWLSLEPAYILRGQVWRLVTWVLYPPSTSGVLWFAIAVLFFYYPIGTSLERTIGTFKYMLYILYQFVNLPCICTLLSGYAGSAYVYHSGEDEMDGNFLCSDRCI